LFACGTALSFFYMVAAWGGYAFIINIIPIYVVMLIVLGKYSYRLYTAYSAFYVMGTLLAMQIPFVGFQAVTSSEHLASHAVFVFLQGYVFTEWIKTTIGQEKFKNLAKLVLTLVAGACVVFALYVTITVRDM
jgi:dolichyl-diphosphooligosaccharide--protein glycosyltransferase